jgi:Transposase IS116/IS110/IS902 family
MQGPPLKIYETGTTSPVELRTPYEAGTEDTGLTTPTRMYPYAGLPVLLARHSGLLARVDAIDADSAVLDAQIEAHLAPFDQAVDRLDEIPGIGPVAAAIIIIAEIGVDMTRFPTAGHLCSWAKFSPGTPIRTPVSATLAPITSPAPSTPRPTWIQLRRETPPAYSPSIFGLDTFGRTDVWPDSV